MNAASDEKNFRRVFVGICIVCVIGLISVGVGISYRHLWSERLDHRMAPTCTSDQLLNAITPAHERRELITLLFNTTNILDGFKIKNFIIGGTLLGAVREGSILLWDDDVDIGVLKSEWQMFYNENTALWNETLQRYKLRMLFVQTSVPKIVFISDWLHVPMPTTEQRTTISLRDFVSVKNAPFLDIFEFDDTKLLEVQNDRMLLSSPLQRAMWPREYFTPSELFPLRKYAIHSGEEEDPIINVWGPRFPFLYLNRNYGASGSPAWIQEAVVQSHHDPSLMWRPCRIDPIDIQFLIEKRTSSFLQ